MSDEPHVTVGKRRPFWEGYDDWKTAVLELASPLLFVWSVYWFVGLVRVGHLFDNEHIGHTVIGGLFFGFVGVLGLVGIWMLSTSIRTLVLDSACPLCGAQRTRSFGSPADPEPAACGTCLAYLRGRGLEVREEAAEAVTTIGLPYSLPAERYLPVVTRDHRNHYKFAWPEMCAVCGATATKHREIDEWGKIDMSFGAVGTVVHVAANAVGADVMSRDGERVTHNAVHTSRSSGERLDRELSQLKVPVCAKHTLDEDRFATPLQYRDGKIVFASYRYYRAFCELNHIGATLKSETSATGSPTASSPQ